MLYDDHCITYTGEEEGEGADRDTAGRAFEQQAPSLQVRPLRRGRGDPRGDQAALQERHSLVLVS